MHYIDNTFWMNHGTFRHCSVDLGSNLMVSFDNHSMLTPSLPVELHDLIIDEIGSELESDAEEYLQRCMQCLHACALVCRHWHIHTLPYIFGSVDLVTDQVSHRYSAPPKQLERLERLLKVMDSNPFIRGCIKSLAFTPHIGWDVFDEQMAKLALHRNLVSELLSSFQILYFPLSSLFDAETPV